MISHDSLSFHFSVNIYKNGVLRAVILKLAVMITLFMVRIFKVSITTFNGYKIICQVSE